MASREPRPQPGTSSRARDRRPSPYRICVGSTAKKRHWVSNFLFGSSITMGSVSLEAGRYALPRAEVSHEGEGRPCRPDPLGPRLRRVRAQRVSAPPPATPDERAAGGLRRSALPERLLPP